MTPATMIEREDVREHLREDVHSGDGVAIGVAEPERERRREAEEAREEERAERPPVAGDHGREGDEAAAGRHVLVESADHADRQERTARPREDTGERHPEVAHAVDADADGVRGARMLADGSQPEAEGRLEHHEVGDDHEQEPDPDHHAQSPEGAVQEVAEAVRRDALEEPHLEPRDLGDPGRDVLRPVELHERVAGYPDREQVDRGPSDDLVGAQMDGEDRVQQPEQPAGGHADEDARDPVAGLVGSPDAPEGAHEHHPLEADVHDPAPLGEDAPERPVDERRREDEHRGDQRRPREDDLEVVDTRPTRKVGAAQPQEAEDDRAPARAHLHRRALRRCLPPQRSAAKSDRHDEIADVDRRQREPERERAEDDADDADPLRRQSRNAHAPFPDMRGDAKRFLRRLHR